MGISLPDADDALIRRALRSASDTRFAMIGESCRHMAGAEFVRAFGAVAAVIVADRRTFDAAGRDVRESLRGAEVAWEASVILDPSAKAEWNRVEELTAALARVDAVPIAVGSGTINDLTKLASHRLGRPYMAVATAASMDGYTAFGASITRDGSKQTFECPAPRAVLADLEVIAAAPAGMNAWGYADLLAKFPAGSDWLIADALGEEPLNQAAWDLLQPRLPHWLTPPPPGARPAERVRGLTHGLLLSGFAMQAARSSRPASGAEHQFSHLWDMEGHTHLGVAPSHGFKVGVGTLASLAFHDLLAKVDPAAVDVEAAVAAWPDLETELARVDRLFGSGPLAEKAREETRAKHPTREALRAQLTRLREVGPALWRKLAKWHMALPFATRLLAEAGCPTTPEAIGIERARMRRSFGQAYHVRRRFTVLDLARRLGLTDAWLDRVFGRGGLWPDV